MTIKQLGGIFGRNPTFNNVTIDGGIYFEDGQSGNLLNDYEEGTWTATLSAGSGSITLDSGADTLWYVKVGRVVHFGGNLSVDSVSSPSGDLNLRGWPFQQSTVSGASNKIQFSIGILSPALTLAGDVVVYWPENSDLARLRDNNGSNPMADHIGSSTNIYLNGSFLTD